MNEQERKAAVTLCLMAAFADGSKHERERAEIRNIAEALGQDAGLNVAALLQEVMLKRASLATAAAALTTPESRRLAFELAVGVCDADGAQSAAEREFLAALRDALGLDQGESAQISERAEALATAPVATAAAAAPAAAASTLSREAQDQMILNAAILNGAIELLPESLSTMAIIPLQMRLVYRIGQSYSYELDRGHIKDFLATAGVGLTSQYLEQAGRKLLGGLLKSVGGGMLGGLGKQAVSSGMSFASTWALGHAARHYYAGGRKLDTQMLRQTFSELMGEARNLQSRYLPQMQAQARTLDAGQLLQMVRQG
ncbi:MAG: DUF533 domain-containing protein [Betaproteobacteria bacterium]|nr:DUF533 domain-containing protein [Betaproteobacteria bacterium]